ncbi:MAG: PP2C family serine/threonine-protein phosphatase [Pyrinomonadaceae bacterium]
MNQTSHKSEKAEKANWKVAAASVVGTSHLDSGTDCQDRFRWSVFNKDGRDILIAVISDGAGSTTDGERGADIACESFESQVCSILDITAAGVASLGMDFAVGWLGHYRKLVKALADEESKETREFSSTFVAAVADHENAVFFQLGDGGVIYNSANTEGFCFGIEPDDIEYVNMTNFLMDDDAFEHLKVVHVAESVEDLVLFSDGITNVAVDHATGSPYEPFLKPMTAPLKNGSSEGLDAKLEAFLSSPSINEKTDDDKTLILASNVGRESS